MLKYFFMVIACSSIVLAAPAATTLLSLPGSTPTCHPGQKFYIQAVASGTKLDGTILSRGSAPTDTNYLTPGTAFATFQPFGRNATTFFFNSDCTLNTTHSPSEKLVGYYATIPRTPVALNPNYGTFADYQALAVVCKVDQLFNVFCEGYTKFGETQARASMNDGQFYLVAPDYPTESLGSPPGIEIKLRQILVSI